MPNFYIPKEESVEQRERVIKSLVKYLEDERNAKISSERIFQLNFVHDGENFEATVGKKGPYDDEIVVAILYDENYKIYFIFTYSRGVAGGSPIMVGKLHERSKILFDNSP